MTEAGQPERLWRSARRAVPAQRPPGIRWLKPMAVAGAPVVPLVVMSYDEGTMMTATRSGNGRCIAVLGG